MCWTPCWLGIPRKESREIDGGRRHKVGWGKFATGISCEIVAHPTRFERVTFAFGGHGSNNGPCLTESPMRASRLRRDSVDAVERGHDISCTVGGFDLGGQNVPVLIAERLRDQLQSFGMCGFDSLCFQSVAQRARHCFRIAEIAHESTSSSANGKDRACLADPFANG